MRFSIKYLPVYAIMADLLFTVGLNIKEALLPDSKPLPGDGLPIAPEFAFGWIQVAVNGGMTCVLLWAMIMLMRMNRYSAAGERLRMTMPRTLTALVVLAFSLPSAWLWIWSAWVFFNTGQVFADFCCRRMKKRFRRAKSFQKRLIGLAADARRAQERTPSA